MMFSWSTWRPHNGDLIGITLLKYKFETPCRSGYTTTQLHLVKPELRFCAGSDPARGVSEIRNDEDL